MGRMFYFTLLCVLLGMVLGENDPVGSLENLPSPLTGAKNNDNVFQSGPDPATDFNIFQDLVKTSETRNIFETGTNQDNVAEEIEQPPLPPSKLESPQNYDSFDLSRNSNVFDSINNEEKKDLLTDKLQDISSENGSENQNIRQDSPRQLEDNEDDNDVEEEEDDWYHDPDNVKGDDFDNDDEPKDLTKGSEEDRGNAYVQNDDDDGEEEVDEEFWARFESRDKDHRDNVMNNVGDDDVRDEKLQLEDEEKKYLGDLEDEEELIKKNHKPPTAPSKMVLFYTWMIVAILVMVIAASTYQAKCKGLLSGGNRQQSRGEDRKRLLDNEFV